jgi:Mg-chelatase subunit ChlD
MMATCKPAPRLQSAPPTPDRGPIRVITDLIDRERAGRRNMETVSSKRIIGAMPYELTESLAVARTLTAAAQRGVRATERGLALDASDLKRHKRRGPGLSHVLFLVDASGSMATNRRLDMAKGEAGPIVLGRAGVIARELGAECIAIDALNTSALALRINRRLETL